MMEPSNDKEREAFRKAAPLPTGEDEHQQAERIMLDFNSAIVLISETMLGFARYVANEQGACDTGSMESMMEAARKRFEEKEEEEFA